MLDYLIIFLEFLVIVITMLSMALVADKFLIPSLTNIAKKYSLSEQAEGILLAIGASIPEFTTNLIASLSNSVDIGIGAIAGSGSYDFTICFGFASLFTLGMNLHAGLYYRDSIVYLLTLGLLTYFLIDQKIKPYEAAILTCLWPIYIVFSMYKSRNDDNSTTTSSLSVSLDRNSSTSNHNEEETEHKDIKDIDNEIDKEENNIVIQITNDDHNNEVISNGNDNRNSSNSNGNNTPKRTHFDSIGSNNSDSNKDNNSLVNEDEDFNLIHPKAETSKGDDIELKVHPTSDQAIVLQNKTLYSYLERIYETIGDFYSNFIPLWENYPIWNFCIIMALIFCHSNLIVFIIQNVSDRLKISKTFLGMTIISWGGNIGDTITACVAAKINASTLISTSILGSQITNLQLCLGFPWLIAMIKQYLQGGTEINIVFGSFGSDASETQNNPLYYFIPLLFCVLLSMLIFGCFRMRLNKASGALLSLVYITYFSYESYIQAH